MNTAHIAEHGVHPEEATEIVLRASRPFPQRIGRGRYLIRGQTSAGRYLQVIHVDRSPEAVDPEALGIEDWTAIESGEPVIYVIHARDLTDGERRTIRRRNR